MLEHESIALIKEYRKYLRKLLGKQLEETSVVWYASGYYYNNWAQRFDDGSVDVISSMHNFPQRKAKFIEEIERLKERTE